jgi:hypothetical protein
VLRLWVVRPSTAPVDQLDQRILDYFQDMARDLSSNVFGGRPVAVELLDANYNVGKRIASTIPPPDEEKEKPR